MFVTKLNPFFLFALLGGVAALSACVTTRETRRTAVPSYLVGIDIHEDLAALQRDGRFAEAQAWIDERFGKNLVSPRHPLFIEQERLARIRRDYSQTPEALLAAVRESLPETTARDLERWRRQGHLQWARIDGELFYFRKEPRNYFRLFPVARAPEGDPNTRATERFDLHRELERLVTEGEAARSETPGDLRIQARHRVIVKPGVAPPGETIRCWIPFPQEYERQREVLLLSSSHPDVHISANGIGQRTAYMEGPAAADGQPTEFFVEYQYTTSAYMPELDAARVETLSPDHPIMVEYTRPRPPHVDLTPEVRALAAEIVGGETNPLLAAGKIFRWMDANIRYCSEMEYSTLGSITDKVMTERVGDCGVQVLLFVALCRASDIPARWQSGWSMRPGSENLHDWAEYYVAPYGWIPADPSFGIRRHDDPEIRDFYMTSIDPFRMIANLDFETEFDPPMWSWRSDNIDNQRGEVEWKGGNLYYDQWNYRMEANYKFLSLAEE